MKNPDISIVIPAYNEEKSIKKGSLKRVHNFLKKQTFTWEVLITNDGSTDKTLELSRAFSKTHKNFKVLDEPHRGKGGTVIAGALAAKGNYVFFSDMDQSTPINHVLDFLPEFKKGADIVIGTRTGRKGAPIIRKLMAFGFVLLRTMFLRLPYKDTQCGFKAFTREAAQKVFKKMGYFAKQKNVKGAAVNAGFDIEFLYIARKMGFKTPVTWNFEDTRRVSPIKSSLEAVKDILRIRLNALLGKYKQ